MKPEAPSPAPCASLSFLQISPAHTPRPLGSAGASRGLDQGKWEDLY